jgi:hypothetical protein
MRRREFITLIGGAAALVSPRVARAQQPATPVIGFLHEGSHPVTRGFGRSGVDETDHRHRRRLLRPCRPRPHSRRAAEKADKLPSPHGGEFLVDDAINLAAFRCPVSGANSARGTKGTC